MSLDGALDDLQIDVTRESNDELWALCPNRNHSDRKPSWSINRTSLRHHCFSCGYSGTFIGLAADVLECTPIVAARWARSHGVKPGSTKDLDRTPLEVPCISEGSLAQFTTPPVGECNDRRFTVAQAERYGVRWDTRRKAWVCPTRDPWSHELWGWQLKFTEVKSFRNYPQGLRRANTLFAIESFPLGASVILIESPLDVPRIGMLDGFHALALCGSSLSEAQLRILVNITDEVILFLDNPAVDDAGYKAMETISKQLKQRMIRFTYASYEHTRNPLAKDPGDMEDDAIWDAIANRYRRMRTVPTSPRFL